jgi:hypothetical protein
MICSLAPQYKLASPRLLQDLPLSFSVLGRRSGRWRWSEARNGPAENTLAPPVAGSIGLVSVEIVF